MNYANQEKSVVTNDGALVLLLNQLSNANNPMATVLDAIQLKLHKILDQNFPEPESMNKTGAEYQNNSVCSELEIQINLAHKNTTKAEKILAA